MAAIKARGGGRVGGQGTGHCRLLTARSLHGAMAAAFGAARQEEKHDGYTAGWVGKIGPDTHVLRVTVKLRRWAGQGRSR